MAPSAEQHRTLVRAIVGANLYMVLGTADAGGRPWTSPVFYATRDALDFYWISAPEATHSRNLAARPQVSIVVFDSTAPAGSGQAVYMAATAGQVAEGDLAAGLEVYPGPAARGGRPMRSEQLLAPAAYRLYRASVTEHSILCPREAGEPCAEHGRSFDHRTVVTL
jgi:hypothetical protein